MCKMVGLAQGFLASLGEKKLIPLFDGNKEIRFDRLIELYIYRYIICVTLLYADHIENEQCHSSHTSQLQN